MTKQIESDATENASSSANAIRGNSGSMFLGPAGDQEIDPGHLWIYRIDGGTTTLFAEIFVEPLGNGKLREHWFLYTYVANLTHPSNSTALSKYVWPGQVNTNVTMKFSYKEMKLKKADGTEVLPADYRAYLKDIGILTTYIISDPQVQ